MKVLNVLLDNSFGGPGRQALYIAKDLKKYDIKTIFLIPKRNGDFSIQAMKEGFKVYKIIMDKPQLFSDFQSFIRNMLWIIRFFYSVCIITKLIRNERIDIVHVNGLLCIQPVLASIFTRRKIVWHLISSLYPSIIVFIIMPFVKLVSHKKILLTKKLAKYYTLNRKDNSVSFIRPSIDNYTFDPSKVEIDKDYYIRKIFGCTNQNNESIIIGNVANFTIVKGHEYLIKATHMLNKSGYHITLILVGEKVESQIWYYENIKKLVKELNIEKNVKFLDWRNDIPQILKAIDIFVMSSLNEGIPIAILEAMAMEKPVISTDVGGISDPIKHGITGILVPPQNPEAIAKAIIDLHKNPNKAHYLGKKARERTINLFSHELCVMSHKTLYQSLNNNKLSENS